MPNLTSVSSSIYGLGLDIGLFLLCTELSEIE